MTCHQELLLDLNADCAEFCHSPDHYSWLAVGTYQLDEATRTRHGRLYLYHLQQQQQQQQQQQWNPRLQQLATLDVPGIFDLQWTYLQALSPTPCMGLALADGTLRIVTVTQQQHAKAQQQQQQQQSGLQMPEQQQAVQTVLNEACSCQAVASGMALALDWSQQDMQQQQHPLAAISSSDGTISLVQVQDSGLRHLCEWKGHDLEAWMAHWDKQQPHVLYSGADDCTFKGWDTRTACCSDRNTHDEAPQQAAIFTNRKAHGAGVCCISSHPRKEHLLVTGSYDEKIRLWDMRMVQRPMETCQTATGGGVWRLKWHPRKDTLLLAACMYNGFALVQADEAWTSLQVVEEYKGHENIAYGADWFQGPCDKTHVQPIQTVSALHPDSITAAEGPDAPTGTVLAQCQQDVIATCSFYDRRLHIWSPKHAPQQLGA